MSYELYTEQLSTLKESTGKLIGLAIKDKQVSLEQYAKLCNIAKEAGFKFAKIEFQP
jgi:hypothetical protein